MPIIFAIDRIAEHHYGGNDAAAWGAAWDNVELAIKEGKITPWTGWGTTDRDDMLSRIVASTVSRQRNSQTLESDRPPFGTLLRQELEETYDPIFAEDGEPAPLAQPDAKQASYPGRRSQMSAIEQEMRRRAKEGELGPSLAAETRTLSQWAVSTFPGIQTPKPRSIGNALRELFRELTSENSI